MPRRRRSEGFENPPPSNPSPFSRGWILKRSISSVGAFSKRKQTGPDRWRKARRQRARPCVATQRPATWRIPGIPLKRVNPSVWPSADRLRTKKIHFPFVHSFSHVPKGAAAQWDNAGSAAHGFTTFLFAQVPHTFE